MKFASNFWSGPRLQFCSHTTLLVNFFYSTTRSFLNVLHEALTRRGLSEFAYIYASLHAHISCLRRLSYLYRQVIANCADAWALFLPQKSQDPEIRASGPRQNPELPYKKQNDCEVVFLDFLFFLFLFFILRPRTVYAYLERYSLSR